MLDFAEWRSVMGMGRKLLPSDVAEQLRQAVVETFTVSVIVIKDRRAYGWAHAQLPVFAQKRVGASADPVSLHTNTLCMEGWAHAAPARQPLSALVTGPLGRASLQPSCRSSCSGLRKPWQHTE